MVLITGADGYVGTNLVDTLRVKHGNLKILRLIRKRGITLESENAKTITGDIVEFKSIINAFKNVEKTLDSMANKGVLHKNKAARTKSRLNKQVKAL